MRYKALAIACLVASACPVKAQRLPASVVPEHYQMRFTPDFTREDFSGDEVIQVRVLQPASKVTLNALEIDFQDSSITSGGTTQVASVTTDPEREQATLTVSREIAPGPAEIHIRFKGKLNDKLRGFYLARADGRKYAVTQFEPTDARRAFPGFDEPALKATFSITLVIDQSDTAISNGRIISDTPGPGPGKHTVRFSTTPKMSSYLVAMAVGKFECLEGGADSIPIRVCATPGKKELGSFALESAEHILGFYDRYYGIKYPFGKLDLVGVPDFEAGAMENTAAIFYRETALLVDNKNSSVDARKGVLGTIAHEMAHMWFGDLVTMKWWDDIWLNEGFATWMTHKPVQDWKPEWNDQTDEAEETDGSLTVDSLESTRAIRTQAETSAQINELFDGIAYGKTAAVLRMVEAYVGKEAFRRGVNAYLKEHAYSNATAEDFWGTITKVSGKPVDRIMASFVDQPGAPLVSVTIRCDGDTTAVTLEQQRYFADRALFDAGSRELWQVPVCMRSGPGKPGIECVLLTQKRQTFNLKVCSTWILTNAGSDGFYRTEYTPAALGAITRRIAGGDLDLTPKERIGLLGDEWAMVRLGRYRIGDYLGLVEALRDDHTRAVAESALGRLVYIGDYLADDGDRSQYQAWVRSLIRPLAQELGFDPVPADTDERLSLRGTALGILGYTGRDPEVMSWARSATGRYMADPASVAPSLAGIAVQLAAENGGAALYDQFVARMEATKAPEDYYRYLFALTAFKDPALLKRTLEYSLSDEVRNQDAAALIGAVLGNPAGRDLGWTFVKEHWADLQKKLTTWSSAGLVRSTGTFCDARDRDDIGRFFTQYKVATAERSLKQTLEGITDCINLKSGQEANLKEWLEGASPESGGAAIAPGALR